MRASEWSCAACKSWPIRERFPHRDLDHSESHRNRRPYWNIVMFPAHFGIYSLGDYSVHAREGADVHDAVSHFLMQVDGASSREDHLSHGSVAGEIVVCQLQQLGHVRLLSPRE